MKLLASTFAVLALLAAVGQAAPLDSKNVAADAKWVAHVDVDAVHGSLVVKKAFETCPLLKNESGKHFDRIRQMMGVDLRKDLHGITLYGRDTDKTHGVAIVFATVNQKLLLEKAGKATDHKVTKHGKIDIHSWTQKCGPKTHTAAGAFYKPDVLVFAASVERVAAAIDVLSGKLPGITDPKSPLGGRVYAGSSILVRAIAIRPESRCPVLKQAQSFRVALGENQGKSFYHASLVMNSPAAAAEVKAINDGFKALASLKFSGNADVMKLVNGLQATVKDNTVRVRWESSADDVWTVVAKLAKKAAAEHMKKGGACPFFKHGKGGHPFALGVKAGQCPAGCQCPACKAKAKATCPAGCQCPACKAKAEAKGKGNSIRIKVEGLKGTFEFQFEGALEITIKAEGKAACPAGCQCPACKAKAKGQCPAGCQCPACKAKAEAKGKCPAGCQCPACKAKAKGQCSAGCQCPACKAKAETDK
jgi:hypothetical protein